MQLISAPGFNSGVVPAVMAEFRDLKSWWQRTLFNRWRADQHFVSVLQTMPPHWTLICIILLPPHYVYLAKARLERFSCNIKVILLIFFRHTFTELKSKARAPLVSLPWCRETFWSKKREKEQLADSSSFFCFVFLKAFWSKMYIWMSGSHAALNCLVRACSLMWHSLSSEEKENSG